MTEFAGIQSVLVLFMCFLQSSPVYLVNTMHTWNMNLCQFSSWNHVTSEYKKLITACCFNLCSWHLVTRLLTLDVLYKILTITYKMSILNIIQKTWRPTAPNWIFNALSRCGCTYSHRLVGIEFEAADLLTKTLQLLTWFPMLQHVCCRMPWTLRALFTK
jgi:hypothetical protein